MLCAILAGRVCNGSLLSRSSGESVFRQFFGEQDGDGHLFWECSFPTLGHLREHPKIFGLFAHYRVALLAAWSFGSTSVPWPESVCEVAAARWVTVLGPAGAAWTLDKWDEDGILDLIPEHPCGQMAVSPGVIVSGKCVLLVLVLSFYVVGNSWVTSPFLVKLTVRLARLSCLLLVPPVSPLIVLSSGGGGGEGEEDGHPRAPDDLDVVRAVCQLLAADRH